MTKPLEFEDKSCEWEDSLGLYVLGNLVGQERIALEAHLAGNCAKCIVELSRATEVLVKLGGSSDAGVPVGLRGRFLKLLDKEPVPEEKTPDQSVLFIKSGIVISRSEAIPWRSGEIAGIWAKALFVDADQGCVTSLIRMDPGSSYPPHRHAGTEEIYLLSGEITVEGKQMQMGDYCRAVAGSLHSQSFTNSGCTFILRACA